MRLCLSINWGGGSSTPGPVCLPGEKKVLRRTAQSTEPCGPANLSWKCQARGLQICPSSISKSLPEIPTGWFHVVHQTLTSLWKVGLTTRSPVPGRKPILCRSLLIFAEEVDICSQIDKKWSVNHHWPRDDTAAQMHELHWSYQKSELNLFRCHS